MFPGRKEKIVATIEARMTSSRLPGKVMLPLMGRPALQLMIERLKHSRYLDAISIATTTNDSDDVLEKLAHDLRVFCFRGSESDVLGRVLSAARSAEADTIVELTGDCPFIDSALVDRGIQEFFSRTCDYAANCVHASYPSGFEVQVFSTNTLAEAARLTDDPIDRTHVSYYIYMHPERFACHHWKREASAATLRLTLDEQADYDVLTQVAEAFSPNHLFTVEDAIRFLRLHPDVANRNRHVRQKEAHEL